MERNGRKRDEENKKKKRERTVKGEERGVRIRSEAEKRKIGGEE